MPVPTPAQLDSLLQTLRDLLAAHPEGLSEYRLLGLLEAAAPQALVYRRSDDPLRLFRLHFLVFHALYRLRDRCHAEGSATLEISPLRIRLGPYSQTATGLTDHDPLRAYYLDLKHLETTDREAVDELIGQFWVRLAADERRQSALAVLGLSDPVDFATIRRRYRRLAMRHHPDRGGDGAQFQAIRSAYATLAAGTGQGVPAP